jgi:hypothetical protein
MPHDDQGKRWVFGTGDDSRHAAAEAFTDQRVAELVRAAVGNGTAGPGLLDTDDAERRPTGLLTMARHWPA